MANSRAQEKLQSMDWVDTKSTKTHPGPTDPEKSSQTLGKTKP